MFPVLSAGWVTVQSSVKSPANKAKAHVVRVVFVKRARTCYEHKEMTDFRI